MKNLVIEIEKKQQKEQADKKLQQRKQKKLFDARRFAGRMTFNEDPLTYQKRLRDEWD